MEVRSIEAIIRALNESAIRYLIAGGVAVIAHGYLRSTDDLDLILDLNEENLRRALHIFAELAYQPKPPVALELFADAQIRAQWGQEKGARVFSLFSSAHPTVDNDLFLEAPLDFERAYSLAIQGDVVPGLPATFIGLEDLRTMKRQAARPKDLVDLEHLHMLEEEDKHE